MKNIFNNTLFLRLPIAIILLVHGMGGMFNNGINNFGNLYLNQIGFAPIGLLLAWAIKLSHVLCAICLLINKFIFWPVIITIIILIMGIVLIHYNEGWFVVGAGRNGLEFNLAHMNSFGTTQKV